ncbi:FadR/GntR family transcriptional regulator [Chryseolinea lacunae]|uniref:FadR family transcriptional regulator n=1 Tax=Chryseolinea lacunae TaxID=2801331 RepID=A0ABS1KTT9_9BACT|nr:FadR/GntR family transcriptional regulator [Chryseolinea lacunae]MBL0742682.1 FadR family transcriptional regulator [Chryseolinea lacunae]
MSHLLRKSLSDEVAARLQEKISLGHYKAGDKLPIEPELMKTFGVGRSTIREAIKVLANAGFLNVRQGLGTFVEAEAGSNEPFDKRLKRARMQEVDDVREVLELKIAAKAALNRTEKDLRTIEKHLTRRKKAATEGDLEACVEADVQFHISVAEATKNQILADLYRVISVHLKKGFMRLYKNTDAFKGSQPLHEKLLKAIAAQNTSQASDAAEKIVVYKYSNASKSIL